MRNYKELGVWQKAVRLASETYRVTQAFPQAERFGLTSQARRAATSVPANIAEGWGRGSTKEYIQFLMVARGSLMELETHLIIAQDLGYIAPEQFEPLRREIEEVGRMLNGLVSSLRTHSLRAA